MNQQIILSGTGGQGILFLTRFFAEAALECGLAVLTSEIHGMAMRGGTVLSHVKVGSFSSPLVRYGQADAALIMSAENVAVHEGFVRPGGSLYINSDRPGNGFFCDASHLAAILDMPAAGNVALLGFAVAGGKLFCDEQTAQRVLSRISSSERREANLRIFMAGYKAGGSGPGAI